MCSRVRVLGVLVRFEIEPCFVLILLLRFENDCLFLSLILPQKPNLQLDRRMIPMLESYILRFCTRSFLDAKPGRGKQLLSIIYIQVVHS